VRGARLFQPTRDQQDAFVAINSRKVVYERTSRLRLAGRLSRCNIANELGELNRIARAFGLGGHAASVSRSREDRKRPSSLAVFKLTHYPNLARPF